MDTEQTFADKRDVVANNCAYFDDMVSELVTHHTAGLDGLMADIETEIINVPDPPVIKIEHYFMKLSADIYWIGSQMEYLGIRDDVSEMLAKEVFNTEYLTQQDVNKDKKLTSATLIALAENKAQYDTVLNSIYSRVYKTVKFKVEAADRMCSTLSKVLSRRMQEMSYPAPTDALGRRILNE